jgi:hypothetical protein
MVVAVTSERLLVLRAGGVLAVKARELVGECPLADVDAIEVARDGKLTRTVTLHVRGEAIGVVTARAQPAEALPAALRRAMAPVPIAA